MVTSEVFYFRTFPCKMKFHDSKDHFMMVRNTNFKNVRFHKTGFKIYQQKVNAACMFLILKTSWIDI